MAFVRKRTGSSDEQVAAALAKALGDLPLALAEATAYIERTQLGLGDYLRLVQERAVELFGLRQPADAHRRVATVWSLSLERIQRRGARAEALLDLCAFLASEAIPRTLPGEHTEVLPEALRELVADPLAYNQALGVLGSYSLATVTSDHVGPTPASPSGHPGSPGGPGGPVGAGRRRADRCRFSARELGGG